MIIIEEDSLTRLNAALVTGFSRADFGNFCLNPDLFKNFLPDFRCLRIFRNPIFFIANKTRYINLFRVKTNFNRQKFEEIPDLFFLKIVTQRPIPQHFKHRSMARITHLFDIL